MKKPIQDNELGRKNEILKDIFCPKCDAKTLHKIVAHNKIFEEDEIALSDEEGIVEIVYFSQIIHCVKCKEPALRNIQVEKEGNNPNTPVRTPQIIPGRKDKGFDKRLLSQLKDTEKIVGLYKECINAYSQEMNFSAGAAIRSLLEEICKNRGCKQKVIQDIEAEKIDRKKNPKYNEYEENEKLDVLNQLQLYKGGDTVNEFDEILKENNRVKQNLRDVTLNENEKESIEIKANLSKQIVYLKEELKAKRPNSTIDLSILSEVVKWGNGTIHGFTTPTTRNVRSAIGVVEFIFHALYVDEAAEASFSEHSSEFTKKDDEN